MSHLLQKITFALLLACLLSSPAQSAVTSLNRQNTEAVMDSLDEYILHAPEIDRQARRKISQQRTQLLKSNIPYEEECLELGKLYSRIDIDSALHYFDLGLAMCEQGRTDTPTCTRLTLAKMRTLPSKGLISMALQQLADLSPEDIDKDMKWDYFVVTYTIYQGAVDVFKPDSMRMRYTRLANAALDSLLVYANRKSVYYDLLEAATAINANKVISHNQTRNHLVSILDTLPVNRPEYAHIAEFIAKVDYKRGKIEDAKKMFALSSISDIACNNYDISSLHSLGKLIYQENPNDKRGYDYITWTLDRTAKAGARLRMIETSEALPMVIGTANLRMEQYRRMMYLTLGVSILFIIAAFFIGFLIRRHHKEITQSEDKLTDSRKKLVGDINLLVNLYADNIGAISNFEKESARKLLARDTRSLLNDLQSRQLSEKSVRAFYNIFDKAFCEAQPNFIQTINELLQEDKKFPPLEENTLNTELRVLALIRMGIIESQQIARILGLSVNSVYSYRTRLKSRALDRVNFEKIMVNLPFKP